MVGVLFYFCLATVTALVELGSRTIGVFTERGRGAGTVSLCHHLVTTGHRPLTLQHGNGGLGTDPGDGGVLAQVVAPRVVAGPALVGPRVLQREARDAQHAHTVGTVGCVDGHATLASAFPQLLEGVDAVDLGIPPLDLRGGVTDHIAVQLKGVPCELCLRHGRFHKPSWRGKVCWGGKGKERG